MAGSPSLCGFPELLWQHELALREATLMRRSFSLNILSEKAFLANAFSRFNWIFTIGSLESGSRKSTKAASAMTITMSGGLVRISGDAKLAANEDLVPKPGTVDDR